VLPYMLSAPLSVAIPNGPQSALAILVVAED
jgi:hypothetical protein